jgi:arylsulfatase A-like enzyme
MFIVANGTNETRLSVRLRSNIRRHRRTRKLAWNAYRRFEALRLKREFSSRISAINPDDYLDTSCKPNLNVIIIIIDALRNSSLSCRGYDRETTPFLDSSKSRFTAISASSWTYPSVASILTGLYPHNHNAIIAGDIKHFDKLENFQKVNHDILTLPEMLYLLGYRIYFGTAIDTAFYPLRTRVIPKRYDSSTPADDLLSDLTKWISKTKGERLFAYVHLGDLHVPLNPPDDFRHFFGNVKELFAINFWNFNRPEAQKSTDEEFQEYRRNRQLLYDNTLRYVDNAIERFYNGLRDIGLADSTILIVAADHGEELWEHAAIEAGSFYDPRGCYGIGHGHSVFNEAIEVPLCISGPVPDMISSYLVSTVDIVPTIIDLLEVSYKMRFDGRSVFEAGEDRLLLNEASGYGYEKKALIIGRHKLIYSKDDGIEWVFDLEKDPQEQHPIVDREMTSKFVEKLLHMLKEDEKRKIRDITRRENV